MKITENLAKAKWSTPVLVEVDQNMEDIENGLAPGTDGAGGLSMLSAS